MIDPVVQVGSLLVAAVLGGLLTLALLGVNRGTRR